MSCAEALRRCPHAVFVAPRHRTYAEYCAPCGRRSARSSPPSSAPEWTRATSTSARSRTTSGARVVAEAVQAAVRGATSLSCSLGVASCKVVAKVASDRKKPGGITVVPAGREAAFLAPFPVRLLPGVGPRAEERPQPGSSRSAGSRRSPTGSWRAYLLPGKIGRLLRDRAQGIDRALEEPVASISIGHEETFPQDVSDRERLHDELRRMALRVAGHLAESGQVARTVTTKLRYPDFSIRSRSTTLAAGLADGERIGQLACDLLDRALADRPERCGSSASRFRRSRTSSSWRSKLARSLARRRTRTAAQAFGLGRTSPLVEANAF